MSDEELHGDSDAGSEEPGPLAGATELPEGIQKDIVQKAQVSNWRKPKKGDAVTVHYVGTLESDGTEFDSSRKRGAPITFTMGVGEVIKGWDIGIATMRKTEIAKFTFQPQFAYGAAGSPPTIPENAVLVFEVELISWIAKDDLFRDGGVIKSQLQEGSGWKHPKQGNECRVSVKATDNDGTALLEEKTGFDYFVGSGVFGPFSNIVDTALADMNVGEKVALAVQEGYVELEGGKKSPEATVEIICEEVYEIVDVSFAKDKSLMKKTVKEGTEYDKPKDGVQATMKVECITDGTDRLPSFSGPVVMEFIVGSGEICDALEALAVDMKRHERCILMCTAVSKCRDARLGTLKVDCPKLVLTVEMADFEKGPELWSLGAESKMLMALDKKDTGAELFKAKRFELALEKYNKVIEFTGQTDGFSAELKAHAAEIKRTVELNKAACYLQMGDPTNALSSCNKVLKEDRYNVKAFFRRAKAHLERNEAVEALADLEQVLVLDPDNKEAKALIPQAKRAQKVHDKESKGMFNKMCDGFGKIGSGREPKKRPTPAAEAPAPEPEPVDKENVVVAFQIEQKLDPEESIYVTGACEALGNWDYDKAVKMSRKSTGPDWERIAAGKPQRETWLWEASATIPQSEGRLEYRYVVRGPKGDRAEDGLKHAVQLGGVGGSRCRCNDGWRNASIPQ